MEISIILTVVLIASVLAYLFLPARKYTDIDGNPVSRPPAKQTPVSSSTPVQPTYRWHKPARSTPAEPHTFRGTGSLTTAEMMLEEGLYQLTCQSAADRKLTVNLKGDDALSRHITTTSGLTKHRISIDQSGNYQLEVQCDAPETTWALLVKPL